MTSNSMEQMATQMRRIAEEEGDRLRFASRRLKKALRELRDHYPTADRLAGEVKAVRSAHADFVAALDAVDWTEVLEGLGEEIDEAMRQSKAVGPWVMRWDTEGGVFRPETTGPAWQRDDRWCVDVATWVENRLEAEAGGQGEGVTYPILFTHQAQANHRAVARAIGWGAVLICVRRRSEDDADGGVVVLRHSDWEIAVDGDEAPTAERPGAEAFGYTVGGELFRRIEQFDEVDADAHWIRWMEQRRRGRREVRVMRERGGARLCIEVDRNLRRLRLVERPDSDVVRNRRHVFAEPRRAQIEDRYFAAQDELDATLDDEIAGRIKEGFRILRQTFEGEFDDGLSHPPATKACR